MHLSTILATVPMVMTLAVQVAGQISQVVDANNFCLYLPPPDSKNRNIADTEWEAQAFCLGNTPQALKANKMPEGFVQSAHYVATDTYVQVTGQIDPVKANLNVTDDGGQMDVAALTCNRGISEKGCAHVIPGDYSGPMSGGDSSSQQPSVSVSVSSSSTASSSSTSASSSAASSSSSAKSSALSSPSAPKSSSSSTGPSDAISAQSIDKSAASIAQPAAAITLLAIGLTLLTQ